MKSQLPTYGAEICRVELPHNSDLRVEDQKPVGAAFGFVGDACGVEGDVDFVDGEAGGSAAADDEASDVDGGVVFVEGGEVGGGVDGGCGDAGAEA